MIQQYGEKLGFFKKGRSLRFQYGFVSGCLTSKKWQMKFVLTAASVFLDIHSDVQDCCGSPTHAPLENQDTSNNYFQVFSKIALTEICLGLIYDCSSRLARFQNAGYKYIATCDSAFF